MLSVIAQLKGTTALFAPLPSDTNRMLHGGPSQSRNRNLPGAMGAGASEVAGKREWVGTAPQDRMRQQNIRLGPLLNPIMMSFAFHSSIPRDLLLFWEDTNVDRLRSKVCPSERTEVWTPGRCCT